MTRKELIRAAKELNAVLGLDPAIDLSTGEEELRELLLEAAELILPEDNISEDTLKVIDELTGGGDSEEDEEEPEPEEETEAKEESEEEPEAKEESEEEPEAKEELESEKPVDAVKPESVPAVPNEPAQKKKKNDKPKSVKKIGPITRLEAAVEAIRRADSPVDQATLVNLADKIYRQRGGKSNIREMGVSIGKAIQVLQAWGALEIVDGQIIKK